MLVHNSGGGYEKLLQHFQLSRTGVEVSSRNSKRARTSLTEVGSKRLVGDASKDPRTTADTQVKPVAIVISKKTVTCTLHRKQSNGNL